MPGKRAERTMSGTKSTNRALSATETTLLPQASRKEPALRWPSVATSGGAAYVSNPEPKGKAGSDATAEG